VTTIDPSAILEDLKAGASPRKARTLDLLFGLLQKQAESGVMDFSIATIGRLSSAAGGPTTQAIRNKGGADYRRLIEAWAASQATTRRKPLSPTNRQKLPTRFEDILGRIEDSALRAVVGTLIAERNRFFNENRILKAQSDIVVDRRPMKQEAPPAVEGPPALNELLTDMEREALQAAVSEEFLEQRGWTALDNGRVKNEDGRSIYKPGYLTAIRKILAETGDG